MKKTLLILITLFTNFVNAQTQVSDYYDASSANRPEFSYNITIRIQKTTGATAYDTRYTATLVQASPDSKGFYNANGDKKFYTCSQLENVCNPNNLHLISVRLSYTCNGQQKADVVVFKNLNDVQQINVVAGAGGKFCESIDFNMNVMGATLEPTHLGQIIDKINQLNSPATNQNKSNTSTQNTNIGNQSNTNTSTEQIPDSYTGNPLHYNNPNVSSGSNTIDNINKSYQQGQQITEIATGLVDLFTPSPEQIRRRAEVQRLTDEKNARITKSCKMYLEAQMEEYFPAANKGDENARMKLCQEFLSVATGQCSDLNYLLPDQKSWLKQAAANKNFYAINYIGISSVFNGPYGFPIFGLTVDQGIAMMDESVNMGNTDAMLLLGIYYSRKKKSPFFGGANAIKSIYYFEKGAKMGNVDCLYSLGMIYRHNYVNEATNIKYKIENDDIAAVNYFSKAIVSRYNEDSETIKPHRQSVTYCIVCSDILKKCYYELSMMYEKGIGCKMDKEIARKFKEEYEKK